MHTAFRTPDLLAIFSSGGRELRWCNEAFERALGPVVGTSPRLVELLDDWSQGHFMVKGLAALIRQSWWRGRLTFEGPDDSRLTVAATVLAHRDTEGDIESLSLSATPIDEESGVRTSGRRGCARRARRTRQRTARGDRARRPRPVRQPGAQPSLAATRRRFGRARLPRSGAPRRLGARRRRAGACRSRGQWHPGAAAVACVGSVVAPSRRRRHRPPVEQRDRRVRAERARRDGAGRVLRSPRGRGLHRSRHRLAESVPVARPAHDVAARLAQLRRGRGPARRPRRDCAT